MESPEGVCKPPIHHAVRTAAATAAAAAGAAGTAAGAARLSALPIRRRSCRAGAAGIGAARSVLAGAVQQAAQPAAVAVVELGFWHAAGLAGVDLLGRVWQSKGKQA